MMIFLFNGHLNILFKPKVGSEAGSILGVVPKPKPIEMNPNTLDCTYHKHIYEANIAIVRHECLLYAPIIRNPIHLFDPDWCVILLSLLNIRSKIMSLHWSNLRSSRALFVSSCVDERMIS